ncbi:hypothetical protein K435DRAFT_859123 [Dendrothele bispora CBS 962.96]|uniref:Uncharacterized protein n=1 Tax=Dendrothele bispora (strain CBS 962.96) TaxID=1314807 RepID=A0A4S8M1A8_DENBC|nr:hypothetical protein K435DRAFT_859123 [Dendrothele bispora CBS 962.96]
MSPPSEAALSVVLLPSEIALLVQALRRTSQTDQETELSSSLQLLLEKENTSLPYAEDDSLSDLSALTDTDTDDYRSDPSIPIHKETIQGSGAPKVSVHRQQKNLKRKKPVGGEEGNGERERFVNAWPWPPCTRNGKRARMGQPEYEESEEVYQPPNPCLDQAEDLIMRLTSGCRSSIFDEECQLWISSFNDNLTQKPWFDCQHALSEQTLSSLGDRCSRSETQGVFGQFQIILSELFFTAKFNSILADQPTPLGSCPNAQIVIDDLMIQNPLLPERHIKDWRSRGIHWVNLIKEKLLPLLVKLCVDMSSLRVPTFFSSEQTTSLNIEESFQAWDISSSDKYFNSFIQHSVLLLQRDKTLWEPVFPSDVTYDEPSIRLDRINKSYLRTTGNLSMPRGEGEEGGEGGGGGGGGVAPSTRGEEVSRAAPSTSRRGDLTLDNSNFIQFPIPFRFSFNQKIPYPKEHYSKIAWADQQREKALKALEPSSIEEFQRKIQANFNEKAVAKKGKGSSWIKLKRELIKGKEIQVNGEDGIVFNVDSTMPDHLKSNLLDLLNLALRGYSSDDQLTDKDTSNNPEFTALHFSYYSKYGTEGTFVPTNIHPHKLKNKNAQKTNHSQFMTRESNDMRDHPVQYKMICDALEPVLKWVVEKRLKRHPDLFADIRAEIDIFPLQDANPVHPFSSFVINLNVKTQPH